MANIAVKTGQLEENARIADKQFGLDTTEMMAEIASSTAQIEHQMNNASQQNQMAAQDQAHQQMMDQQNAALQQQQAMQPQASVAPAPQAPDAV